MFYWTVASAYAISRKQVPCDLGLHDLAAEGARGANGIWMDGTDRREVAHASKELNVWWVCGGRGAPPSSASSNIQAVQGGLQSFGGVHYFGYNTYLLYLSGSLDTHSDDRIYGAPIHYLCIEYNLLYSLLIRYLYTKTFISARGCIF